MFFFLGSTRGQLKSVTFFLSNSSYHLACYPSTCCSCVLVQRRGRRPSLATTAQWKWRAAGRGRCDRVVKSVVKRAAGSCSWQVGDEWTDGVWLANRPLMEVDMVGQTREGGMLLQKESKEWVEGLVRKRKVEYATYLDKICHFPSIHLVNSHPFVYPSSCILLLYIPSLQPVFTGFIFKAWDM